MKTILIPVDFSDAAKHAAGWALQFAQTVQATTVIFYNAYEPPIINDPTNIDTGLNPVIVYDVEELRVNNKTHLNKLVSGITANVPSSFVIQTISELDTLRNGIEELCNTRSIDLIVMGISVADKLTETLMGSASLDIARDITVPVIVVPLQAVYKPAAQILFTCDYKDVSDTIPVSAITGFVATTQAQLHVLHVDAHEEKPEHLHEKEILQTLLQSAAPIYHTLQHADFTAAIKAFTAEKGIDLIIAIPKKHGFFSGLFHTNHIKQLAYSSEVPLMLVHEE